VRAHVLVYLEKGQLQGRELFKKETSCLELERDTYKAMRTRQAKSPRRCAAGVDEAEWKPAENVNIVRTGAVVPVRPGQNPAASPRAVISPTSRPDKAWSRRDSCDREYRRSWAGQRGAQPIRRHGGQTAIRGPERRQLCAHHRVGGPEVRLLRSWKSATCRRLSQVDPRGKAIGPARPSGRGAGPGHRGGVSPTGHDQFVDNRVNRKNRHPAAGACYLTGRTVRPPAFSPASG